jgi:anti-sigma-K factor RskA
VGGRAREAASKVLVWALAGGGMYAISQANNPRLDNQLLAWIVLVAVAAVATAGIGATQRRQSEQAALTERLDQQGQQLDLLVALQSNTTRSDLIHKANKYTRELGWATQEEITSWVAEWEPYKKLGADGYIDGMASKVMDLPTEPPVEHVNH